MAPVDPHELLKEISALLGPDGEIKGEAEAEELNSLMKEAQKLVSRCVYINILKATKDSSVLEKLIVNGGWDTLNKWLQEVKDEEADVQVLLELLKVYHSIPVTVDLLKQNNCAKTIKGLSKANSEQVKTLATEIVEKWMQKIRVKDSSSDKSKKKKAKHGHKSSSNHKDKSLNNGDDDSEDSSKGHHHHHHNHHHHHHSSSKDNANKPSQDDSDPNKKVEAAKPRPRTTKTLPTKFRSTGLEQESVLPPAKRKNLSTDKHPIKKISLPKPSEPPEKRVRPSLPPISTPLTTTTSTRSPSPEVHGKIKLIPPRPKPAVELVESSGFMDALTSVPTAAPIRRKRKSSNSNNHQPTAQKQPTATSPPQNKQPQVPSFYKDTLQTDEDESNKNKEEQEEKTTQDEPMDTSEVKDTAEVKDEQSPEVKEDGQSNGQSDTPENTTDEKSDTSESASTYTGGSILLVGRKARRKKLSWASDDTIKSVRYFEMDETERVNVNRFKDFNEIKKLEMMKEREAMETVKRTGQEAAIVLMPWRQPVLISNLPTPLVEPGRNSLERDIQKQREQVVLQAIYFTKEMIPDSAAEPDQETVDTGEHIKVIPLEDETGGGETYVQEIPTEAQGSGSSSQYSLPPELASLVASMAKESQSNDKSSEPPSPGTVMANMQNLLSSIMTGENANNYHGEEWSDKVKQMLEPFQGQYGENQFEGMNQPNMPPGMFPPNFPPFMRGPPPPRGPFPPGAMGRGMPPPMRGPGMGPPMRGRGGGRGRGRRPCKHFIAKGTCSYGMNCSFAHPGVNAPPM